MRWLRSDKEHALRAPGVPATDAKAAGHIRALVSRVGVPAAQSSSTRLLSTEPVLVFWGEPRRSLGIYDQHGSDIGAAVRIKDRYSRVGYRYHYELSDTELRCVLRDVTRRRLGIDSWTYTFSVRDADGAEIGQIIQSGTSNDSYVITSGGRAVASVRRVTRREALNEHSPFKPTALSQRGQRLFDVATSRIWCIEDEPGHSVARITYLEGRGGAYVLSQEPSLEPQLKTIALTVCIVADNRIIDARHRGGGG